MQRTHNSQEEGSIPSTSIQGSPQGSPRRASGSPRAGGPSPFPDPLRTSQRGMRKSESRYGKPYLTDRFTPLLSVAESAMLKGWLRGSFTPAPPSAPAGTLKIKVFKKDRPKGRLPALYSYWETGYSKGVVESFALGETNIEN